MSSKPASALPLVLKLESSNDSVIDGPSWIPRRETVETSKDLVEFFATNDTASKLKDDALALLKKALMSKNHPREDYEELLRLSYLFLGGEGSAKPFRRPGALHQARWMAKAIYCLKLQMLK
ncbi:hypothetical protein GWK47_038071 [Chionoecetes opilio]|uniref:Uncharacterized protein n=1 Tax=Chionoecetes opilio TaxID=41210 RepID=A0A8J5CYG1_CHIOP|nr:hypothetical protein GWK47_038071 [Chionoecetes opilio]